MDKCDLTQGSVGKMLFRFAVPFMIANILQSLYGAVDLYVVGKFCSPESVAAVSTGTQVTQIVTSLASGLTLGGTVLIGDYVGKRDREKARKTVGTTFTSFFFFSIILTVLMLLTVKPILTVMKTPESSFDLTVKYVGICALGNVFICGYNAVSAVLRGYGDSKRPMIFVGVACFINIVLDFVFVKFFGLDVAGTALATIISQGVSMVLAVIYLKKNNFDFDFKFQSFKPDSAVFKRLMLVGIPISLQELLIRISFLYITTAMNACGLYAAGVVGIGAKYDVFAMLTSTSMASALTAITAQNVGAGKPQRARKALWICIAFSLFVSSIFFAWAQISPESMIGIFAKDSEIIDTGIPYFRTASFDYLMVALVFCLNGYLNGKQKTIFTMLSSSFSAVALRIPMTYIFIRTFGNNLGLIGIIAPTVSAITAIYTVIYVLCEKKTKMLYNK